MSHLSKHERKRKEEGDTTKTTAVSGRKMSPVNKVRHLERQFNKIRLSELTENLK